MAIRRIPTATRGRLRASEEAAAKRTGNIPELEADGGVGIPVNYLESEVDTDLESHEQTHNRAKHQNNGEKKKLGSVPKPNGATGFHVKGQVSPSMRSNSVTCRTKTF